LTCNPKACTGSIKDGDATYFATYDGDALVQEISSEPVVDEGPCIDRATKKVAPGSHYKRTQLYSVTPLAVTGRAAGDPGVPVTFTGTLELAEEVTETSKNCTKYKGTATFERTLKRVM
jgi:hypothetical protein